MRHRAATTAAAAASFSLFSAYICIGKIVMRLELGMEHASAVLSATNYCHADGLLMESSLLHKPYGGSRDADENCGVSRQSTKQLKCNN